MSRINDYLKDLGRRGRVILLIIIWELFPKVKLLRLALDAYKSFSP